MPPPHSSSLLLPPPPSSSLSSPLTLIESPSTFLSWGNALYSYAQLKNRALEAESPGNFEMVAVINLLGKANRRYKECIELGGPPGSFTTPLRNWGRALASMCKIGMWGGRRGWKF
jgi:hypothetical protein